MTPIKRCQMLLTVTLLITMMEDEQPEALVTTAAPLNAPFVTRNMVEDEREWYSDLFWILKEPFGKQIRSPNTPTHKNLQMLLTSHMY